MAITPYYCNIIFSMRHILQKSIILIRFRWPDGRSTLMLTVENISFSPQANLKTLRFFKNVILYKHSLAELYIRFVYVVWRLWWRVVLHVKSLLNVKIPISVLTGFRKYVSLMVMMKSCQAYRHWKFVFTVQAERVQNRLL